MKLKKIYTVMTTAFLMTGSCFAQSSNFSHPMNLQKSHDLNCISPEQLRTEYTPVDLHGAVIACLKKKKLKDARFLFMAYSFYGGFDRRRITDKSAGGAIQSLNFMFSQELSKSQLNKFFEFLNEFSERDELLQEVCKEIRAIGKPTYIPYYMLAHGLKSIKANGDQVTYLSKEELKNLLSQDDDSSVWNTTLSGNGCK